LFRLVARLVLAYARQGCLIEIAVEQVGENLCEYSLDITFSMLYEFPKQGLVKRTAGFSQRQFLKSSRIRILPRKVRTFNEFLNFNHLLIIRISSGLAT